MKPPPLRACPICQGKAAYQPGYYDSGSWVWPSIACTVQYCGLVYQPIIYPDRGEIFERWNALK